MFDTPPFVDARDFAGRPTRASSRI
jgi:hypothetical protein